MDISEQLTYRKETILRLFEDNQISLEGVAAHKNGRMIDGTDIVEGEGPMAPAREICDKGLQGDRKSVV